MSSPIFVAVFAGNCGACIRFKQDSWENLRNLILNYRKVQLAEINISSIGDALPAEYPKDLNRYVKFYPIFMLIPASTWNLGLQGNTMKNVLIYGATLDNSGKVILLPTMSPNKDSIFEWIRNNTENDAIFRAGFVEQPDVKSAPASAGGGMKKENCKMIPTEGSLCTFKILSKR